MRKIKIRKMQNNCMQKGNFIYPFFIFCFAALILPGCKKEFEQKSVVAASGTNASVARKPNIILILFNDLGFEIPTYNGGESYSTPNLDFLAANGMYFQQNYNHPDGTPSRLAIITGKYNFRNYVGWGILPNGEKTIGNMLHDAGYATCWGGKWQLSGNGPRITSAGFDNYLVFLPSGHGQREHRYKDPKLYENGDYLPDSVTKGKYSEDMVTDYIDSFIDNNKDKSFFAMYATLLPAQPWVPTPDDPEFQTWNSENDLILSDQKYYPSMIAYVDKMIGKIRQKLVDDGIENNTVIMVTSATQTDSRIYSQWKGRTIQGTKTNTFRAGTNVPLLVYWPKSIRPGSKTNTLVDFTDYLPTMADIAGVPYPTNYGTLDGTTFYDDMTNTSGKDRDWVFCQWDNNPTDDVPVERFINNTVYKLYDTVGLGNGKFYNIQKDPYEKRAIPDSLLTPFQLQTKLYFRSVLDTLHK